MNNRNGYDNGNPNRQPTGRTTYGNAKRHGVLDSDEQVAVIDAEDALPAPAPTIVVELPLLRGAANSPDLADTTLQGTRAMSWTMRLPTRCFAREGRLANAPDEGPARTCR